MSTAVKIYSTPTCIYCKMAKDYLLQNSIDFEDIDIAQNKETAKELIAKSGQIGVPVLEIDGKIIIGFDKDKIKSALNL